MFDYHVRQSQPLVGKLLRQLRIEHAGTRPELSWLICTLLPLAEAPAPTIRDGSYKVNAEAVADKVIQSIGELMGRQYA